MNASPAAPAPATKISFVEASTVPAQQDRQLQQQSSNSSSATEQADVRHQVGTVQVNGGSSITEPSSNSSTAAVESDNQQQQQQQQPVQQQRQQTATSSSSGYYTDEADNATVQVRPEDIVTLNVGGRLFSCRRRTLCLVEESLLALMFGGRWPGGLATDAQGHVFLDLDPQLFEIVLNWLRQFNIYRGGNIHEPHVPPDKMVHMVAMLDYLQLHRQIPLTYHETFDAEHRSPFMLVQDATATRTKVAAQHPGKHGHHSGKALMQFAVSDHPYFDMAVDVTLEVLSFHDSIVQPSPPQYMFLGFMHQAAAAQLDPAGDINSQLTKSTSCYGWLVGGSASYTVRHGKRSQEACHTQRMWKQGEHVTLSLDTQRDLPYATITFLNTVTGLSKSINAESSSATTTTSSSSATTTSSSSSSSKSAKKKRPGLRHRLLSLPPPPQSPEREEILAILRRQHIAPGANLRVGELVVGAALQILEAQGLGVNESLSILRRPGLLQRLVQQVTDVAAQGGLLPGVVQQAAVAAAGAEAAAAVGAVLDNQAAAAAEEGNAAASGNGTTEQAQADVAASAAAQTVERQQQQGVDQQQQQAATAATAAAAELQRRKLPDGTLLPASTAEYEWVFVVGLVHPTDSVRIVSVRRRGMPPGQG